MKAIILAGGGGSRLWPLSNGVNPKQFLRLGSEYSLLQNTVRRMHGMISPEDILIVTNESFREKSQLQLLEIGADCPVLCEPCARNTAPAIGCAVEFLRRQCGDDTVLILPADHMIRDEESFRTSIRESAELAEAGFIVTMGIAPDYPETGFGYIKTGEAAGNGFKVERFVEKPSLETAEKYVASGEYFWNGGIFSGKISTFAAEFDRFCPEIMELARKCSFSGNVIDPELFPAMPKISIDYAVMEKSSCIALVKLRSDWSDLGSWQAVYRIMPKDADGNAVIGNAVLHNVRNSLIYAPDGDFAVADVENMVFVRAGKSVMCCALEASQNVRFLQ